MGDCNIDGNGVYKRLVEAVLFACPAPLSLAQIASFLPEDSQISTSMIRGFLKELQGEYEGRGVNLLEIDSKWAFRTAEDISGLMSVEKQVHRQLPRVAMETLAIIAYHQPVTRAEIENIRGVGTNKGTLDTLMELGWIKPGRRRESLGRPLTWVTTTEFLDHFSLESLTDLPGMDEMKSAGLLDRRPAIETVHQGDLLDGGAEAGQEEDAGQEAFMRVEQKA